MTEKINEYYRDNYPFVLRAATNILRKYHRTDLAADLVAESYVYVTELGMSEGQNIEAVVVNFMTKALAWTATPFKKKYMAEYEELPPVLLETAQEDNEEEYLAEQFDQQQKINHINSTYDQLPPDEKILFDLHFNQGLKSGKLAVYLNLSRTSCWSMAKKLKTKITDSYEHNI